MLIPSQMEVSSGSLPPTSSAAAVASTSPSLPRLKRSRLTNSHETHNTGGGGGGGGGSAAAAGDGRIIVVSYRLPLNFILEDEGAEKEPDGMDLAPDDETAGWDGCAAASASSSLPTSSLSASSSSSSSSWCSASPVLSSIPGSAPVLVHHHAGGPQLPRRAIARAGRSATSKGGGSVGKRSRSPNHSLQPEAIESHPDHLMDVSTGQGAGGAHTYGQDGYRSCEGSFHHIVPSPALSQAHHLHGEKEGSYYHGQQPPMAGTPWVERESEERERELNEISSGTKKRWRLERQTKLVMKVLGALWLATGL